MLGKRVRVRAKGKEFVGVVMPSSTGSFVLKLDNGYNVGFTEYEIVEVLEDRKIAPRSGELRVEKDWKRAFEESLKENDEALRILAKM